ncbi:MULTISPECIES: carboxypeptidase regulatory-like domain-containing protein [unclassified Massilia]|uniref:TonB-dependent receptor n=1 Tax=unclassified Massilia TaxID=2609279 RepID=UPI001E3235BA|nr:MULTISPECIES: carboxypeptidase regulatory-like domain-containing protein [unclassified Massilia]
MPTAMAQSNASGTVFGKVAAGSGDTVVLKSNDTNATRSATLDATGNFRVTSLPIGTYTVTLTKGGATVGTTQLEVLAGQGVEASFDAPAAVAGTAGVQSVRVTGRRNRIDVSSSNNGATFTARELERLPIGRNVESIVQLAPNTTRGDPSYPAGASFGGGGASENAYYINGMVATNALTQLGAMELPFGAIAQAQILTGGFGVEFGRSTGGVVNITTKSGTNTWEAGAMASITPRSTRASYRDQYYANTGAFDTDGTLYLRRQDNKLQQTQTSAWVGGPLIPDTLFGFVALEQTKSESDQVVGSTTSTTLNNSGFRNAETTTKRYYGKLDWNINDNHRLEFTAIGDLPKTDYDYRSYDYATRAVGSTVTSSIHQEFGPANANGGELQSLRYIGNLTDNLTINALYGKTQSRHIYEPVGYNPNLPQVSAAAANRAPGLSYVAGQRVTSTIPLSGSKDDVTSKRLDLEYKLGNHTLRAGLDNNKAVSTGAGEAYAGGSLIQYQRTTTPNQPINVSGGSLPALAQFGGLAAQGYYVRNIIYSTISNAYAGQDAQYLEDRWQVTKDVLLTAGLRREGFYNANQDNTKYIEMKNQYAPRVNASWDVNGDASFKVFGSLGRYTIQIPTMVALRGANGSTYTFQYYTYNGTDANGLPTGTTQLTEPVSNNNEYGQAKDPKTVAAQNMKPAYQDEFTIGMERAFSPNLNFGAKVTYRKLKSTIDDLCDPRPFDAYAERNNIDTSNYGGFGCATFNPGRGNEFLVDYAGNQTYTKVNLSAEELGFDKPKRTYAALDVFAEHPYRNGWYGRINYTLSRSRGNTEGQTLSDTTSAQGDVSATQTWDFPELMVGAYGLLPNDRKHQIKAFGFYDVTPEITAGANLLLASGRPRSCSGADPTAIDSGYHYNSAAHYCFGATGEENTLSPRGTIGRLPWEKTLDLNLVYRPVFAKGLSLRMDVYNVLNDQSIQKVYEAYNDDYARVATYEMPSYFTAPRSAKFTVEYNYRFK